MVEGRISYNALHKTSSNDIQNVLEMHLKNRSIDNSILEEGERSIDSPNPRLVDKANGSQNSDGNLVTYSAITADKLSYEEHYLSLKSFLAACNGTYRSELLQLLFPVYSVFVVEQFEMDQQSTALAFFQKYVSDHDGRYKRDIEDLLQLLKSHGSEEHTKMKLTEMKKRRFNIVLTSKIVNYLMQHLRNNNHSVLLQTINKNLDIRILDESKYDTEKNWVTDNLMEIGINEDDETKKMRDSIKSLDSLSKTKPSITLHSFVNAYQG